MEDFGVASFGHATGVDSTHDGGLHCFDWVVLVVTRGCGAGEVVDFIDFQPDRVGDVVADEFKIFVVQQMDDIGFLRSEEVVETDDIMSLGDEPFAEMGTKESGTAGDEYALHRHGSGSPGFEFVDCGFGC